MIDTQAPDADLAAAAPGGTLGRRIRDGLLSLPAASRLTAEQLEGLYGMAHAHMTVGQYESALRYFSVLALYGATRRHYLAGLALCLQMCGRYEEALRIHALSATMYPERPDASIGASECLMALGRLDEARAELEQLAGRLAGASAYKEAQARVAALLDLARQGASG